MSQCRIIEFDIQVNNELDISLSAQDNTLDMTIEHGSGGKLPVYDGEYEVIPKVDAQLLETKNKSMTNDVQIQPIPYSEVSNPEGGVTVNIAYM